MTIPLNGHRIRRALTDAELDTLLDRIDAATCAGDLLSVTLTGLFDMLLAEVGESTTDYGAARHLDPRTVAIPEVQWTHIAGAVTNRAQAWGTGAQLALDLVNLMPSAYTDPTVHAPRQLRDYRPEVLQLRVSRDATDTIAACEAHLIALANYYGPDSQEHREALASWHRQLAVLFKSGNGERTAVGRDGPLSLLVTTRGLTFGIVFHGARRVCTTSGCQAIAAGTAAPVGTDEAAWRPSYRGAPIVDHVHVPAYPLDAPQPGTWSLHS